MTSRSKSQGLVVLVGAGPGAEPLATAEAISWINQADVIVYDRLAGESLLRHGRDDAKRIDVGKGPGRPSPDQGEINEILIREGAKGLLVVRLKGGDPLVFGRGGEEGEALAEAGVPFRIVPGVTAALAAGAWAGIPLTDRRVASSVAFVTAREDPAKAASTVNWSALAGIDTVVIYMGVGNLREVIGRLIAAGRDGRTPAAIIASAGTPRQQTVTAPLAELPEAAEAAGIAPPAVTIVGDVVTMREKLAWVEKLPLFGRTVLVTRPARQAADLSNRLAQLGAAAIAAPAVEIAEPDDWSAVDDALGRLGEFDLVAFTSVNGVEAFDRRCRCLGLDARSLGGVTIAAIGQATADALRARFIDPDIMPEDFTTAALGEAIVSAGNCAGRRILLPRADIAEPALAQRLGSAGAHVEEVAIYRTVRPAALSDEAVAALSGRQVHWVTFTSASTVANFLALLAEAGTDPAEALAPPVKLAAIGPVTAEAIRAAGLAPAAIAAEHTLDGLVAAIVRAETEDNIDE